MSRALPVAFCVGQEVTLKTRGQKGRATLDGASIRIYEKDTKTESYYPAAKMRSVALVRPHAVGRVIKVDIGSEYLFIAVTHFAIGQFALINIKETDHLFNALSGISAGPSISEFPVPRGLSRTRRFAIFLISAFVSFSCLALLSFAQRYWP
jgi:hypothetical protein